METSESMKNKIKQKLVVNAEKWMKIEKLPKLSEIAKESSAEKSWAESYKIKKNKVKKDEKVGSWWKIVNEPPNCKQIQKLLFFYDLIVSYSSFWMFECDLLWEIKKSIKILM